MLAAELNKCSANRQLASHNLFISPAVRKATEVEMFIVSEAIVELYRRKIANIAKVQCLIILSSIILGLLGKGYCRDGIDHSFLGLIIYSSLKSGLLPRSSLSILHKMHHSLFCFEGKITSLPWYCFVENPWFPPIMHIKGLKIIWVFFQGCFAFLPTLPILSFADWYAGGVSPCWQSNLTNYYTVCIIQ